MKSVIVTGANGFIGQKLVRMLSKNNVKTYAVIESDDINNPFKELGNVEIIRSNLDDIESLYSLIPNNQIDVMYHLAWSGVSTALKDDYEMQIKNISYSINIMKLCHKLKVNKIIFTGSASEYAYNDGDITGYNNPSPSDFYSAAKVSVHYMCSMYAKKNGLNFIWTLISSIYGPKRNDNNLITYTIKSLLSKQTPEFTKLEQIWDYIYVEDLINALYLVGCCGKYGKVYPIGSGVARPLHYYVSVIQKLIDEQIPVNIGALPYKNTSIDNSILDISDLIKDTGFMPKYTFEDGIKETINYFRDENNYIGE